MAINGVRLGGSEYIEINGLIGPDLEAGVNCKGRRWSFGIVKWSLDWN